MVSSLDAPYPMVYERSSGNEKWLVIINPSANKVTAEIPSYGIQPQAKGGSYSKLTYKVGKETDKITVSPVSAVIMKVR